MRAIFSIATNTWRELVRGKVLYSAIFFAMLVVLISALFGSVSIGDQVKVIKDFGLFSISLFSAAFAVIAGASLLHKELSRKTVFNILAKPVERWQFLLGKFLGMLFTAIVMIALMGCLLSAFVYCFEKQIDTYLFYAYAYIVLEMVIVCAAAIFFSSMVVTPILSGLFTFGLFLAGRSVDYVIYFVKENLVSGYVADLLKALYYTLPHLSDINLTSQAVFAQSQAFSPERFAASAGYAVAYAAVLLIISNLIFSRREFL